MEESIRVREYKCEVCGHEMFPEEEIGKCKICGASVEEKELEVEKSEFVEFIKQKSDELEGDQEEDKSVFGLFKDGKLIIKSGERDGGVIEEFDGVERIHVYSEGSLGVAIVNPDYADFPTLKEAEKLGSRVDIKLKDDLKS